MRATSKKNPSVLSVRDLPWDVQEHKASNDDLKRKKRMGFSITTVQSQELLGKAHIMTSDLGGPSSDGGKYAFVFIMVPSR